jgi:hypothetical protein
MYIVCLVIFCFALRSWNSVVSIETRQWAGNKKYQSLILGRGKRFLSLLICPDWLLGHTQAPVE